MSETTEMKASHNIKVNGENIDIQLFAADVNDDFFKSNKKTTTDYRAAMAQAIGVTGKIGKITKMAFGTGGGSDIQGNPVPPSENGPLNTVVITKDITSVTYPIETTACFEARILPGEVTAAINEVALLTEDDVTAAKARMLTTKGVDAESGLIFEWNVVF